MAGECVMSHNDRSTMVCVCVCVCVLKENNSMINVERKRTGW